MSYPNQRMMQHFLAFGDSPIIPLRQSYHPIKTLAERERRERERSNYAGPADVVVVFRSFVRSSRMGEKGKYLVGDVLCTNE